MKLDDFKRLRDNNELKLFAKMFFGAIIVHWIIAIAGYLINNMGYDNSNFFKVFYDAFSSRGDAPHYLNIAKYGYAASGDKANLIVFYPLYPLLIKIFSFVFQNYFFSGILISNICLGLSGYFMYKLINIEVGDKKAYDGYFIYLLYPFGVFMIGIFTESLFIMLVTLCLYSLKKERWCVAAVSGMFAALTRSQGIALLVPAVYEIIVHMVARKKFLFRPCVVCIIPGGTFIYLLINKIVQDDWFAFVKHQAAEPWYNTSHWISTNLAQHYDMSQNYFALGLIIYWIQIFLYFIALAALFYGIKKKISTSLIAFGGAYIFLSYLHGWLISGPRYVMGCVTLYIVYAATDNKILKTAIMMGFGILVIFYTMGLWQGQAIM